MPVSSQLHCGITSHPTLYVFQVQYGRCAKLETPTLSDLLDEVRLDHEGRCGCGMDIGSRAWTTIYPFGDRKDTRDLDTSAFNACSLDTLLESLCGLACDPESSSTFHIFFEGTGRVRKRDLEFFSHGDGRVYKFPEGNCRLPRESDTSYTLIYKTPGMLFVDKSSFLAPSRTQQRIARLPVIRRPKGFGKTTFLSLLEDFLDSIQTPEKRHARLFPYADEPCPDLWSYGAYSSAAIILHLDLATLPVSSHMDEADLRHNCRELINAAARLCYARYRARWCLDTFEGSPDMTFKELVECVGRAVRDCACTLFVGVDNYTAPLLAEEKHPLIESIITEEIFEPIIRGYHSRAIVRSLMIGESVSNSERRGPYHSSNVFKKYTVDLTDDLDIVNVVGLSEDEIVALGNALFDDGGNFLQDVRRRAGDLKDDDDDERIYCTRDVLALARARNDPSLASLCISSITASEILRSCEWDEDTAPLDTSEFDKSLAGQQDTYPWQSPPSPASYSRDTSPSGTKRKYDESEEQPDDDEGNEEYGDWDYGEEDVDEEEYGDWKYEDEDVAEHDHDANAEIREEGLSLRLTSDERPSSPCSLQECGHPSHSFSRPSADASLSSLKIKPRKSEAKSEDGSERSDKASIFSFGSSRTSPPSSKSSRSASRSSSPTNSSKRRKVD